MSLKQPKVINIDSHVGKKLRARRAAMGLTQQALAKALGITFQQIQKYEAGRNGMNASRLCEIATILQMPVGQFFEELNTNLIPSDHNWRVSDRETLELIKAFKGVSSPAIRKRLADLVRAVAEHE